MDSDPKLRFWAANMTDKQPKQVQKDDGVEKVETNNVQEVEQAALLIVTLQSHPAFPN